MSFSNPNSSDDNSSKESNLNYYQPQSQQQLNQSIENEIDSNTGNGNGSSSSSSEDIKTDSGYLSNTGLDLEISIIEEEEEEQEVEQPEAEVNEEINKVCDLVSNLHLKSIPVIENRSKNLLSNNSINNNQRRRSSPNIFILNNHQEISPPPPPSIPPIQPSMPSLDISPGTSIPIKKSIGYNVIVGSPSIVSSSSISPASQSQNWRQNTINNINQNNQNRRNSFSSTSTTSSSSSSTTTTTNSLLNLKLLSNKNQTNIQTNLNPNANNFSPINQQQQLPQQCNFKMPSSSSNTSSTSSSSFLLNNFNSNDYELLSSSMINKNESIPSSSKTLNNSSPPPPPPTINNQSSSTTCGGGATGGGNVNEKIDKGSRFTLNDQYFDNKEKILEQMRCSMEEQYLQFLFHYNRQNNLSSNASTASTSASASNYPDNSNYFQQHQQQQPPQQQFPTMQMDPNNLDHHHHHRRNSIPESDYFKMFFAYNNNNNNSSSSSGGVHQGNPRIPSSSTSSSSNYNDFVFDNFFKPNNNHQPNQPDSSSSPFMDPAAIAAAKAIAMKKQSEHQLLNNNGNNNPDLFQPQHHSNPLSPPSTTTSASSTTTTSMFGHIHGLTNLMPIVNNNVLSSNISIISPAQTMLLALQNTTQDELEQRARKHREEASRVESCKSQFTISQFEYKPNSAAQYSVKVFLGGVPWDMNNDDMLEAFRQFGAVSVQRPGKEVRPSRSSKDLSKAGYLYLIFDDPKSVDKLINCCNITFDDEGSKYIYPLQSKQSRKNKDVQIIPWDKSDSVEYRPGYQRGDTDETRMIFLGALHGMMNSKSIFEALERIFGPVDYVILELDRFDYPMGFGRAQFSNRQSYQKAIDARFVQIVSSRFKKTIQIDPFLEDQKCSQCQFENGPVYCFNCRRYYCRNCWNCTHQTDPTKEWHEILMKKVPSKLSTMNATTTTATTASTTTTSSTVQSAATITATTI